MLRDAMQHSVKRRMLQIAEEAHQLMRGRDMEASNTPLTGASLRKQRVPNMFLGDTYTGKYMTAPRSLIANCCPHVWVNPTMRSQGYLASLFPSVYPCLVESNPV